MGRIIYNGTFDHNVDDKRRVAIPSRWRPDAEGYEFTLLPNFRSDGGHAYIKVVTMEHMDLWLSRLSELPSVGEGADDARRWLGEDSDQAPLDKSGRITIPEKCAAAAGISPSSEVKLVGTLNGFEIWNPITYSKWRECRSKTPPVQLQGVKPSEVHQ